jgi:hypothetical protein
MAVRRWRPARGAAVVALVLVAALVAVSMLPVTTRQGVDYVVTTHRLPLYLKALDFVDRDLNYRALARRVTAGEATEAGRMLALLAWTRANVRDQPFGFPVIDDHVWHIIVRGYGVDEQKADVFATLATYAGLPAYWINLKAGRERLPVALVRVGDRWRVLDVANGLVFRNRRGELATAEEIAVDHAPVATAAGTRVYRGQAYGEFFRGFGLPAPPAVLRAEKQMPWPRLSYEAKRRLGLGGAGAESDPELSILQR